MVRALVVEDNAEMRFILDQMLRSLETDYVDSAATLREARAALGLRNYDVALIDIGLKGENGLDLVHEIRQNRDHRAHDMPFVVVSGQNQASVVMAARDAGADRFITKPLSIYSLSDNLEKAIEARRPAKHTPAAPAAVVSETRGPAPSNSDDDEHYI